jgi:hypothetical protein
MALINNNVEEKAYREISRRKSQKSFWFFVDTFCMMWKKEGGDACRFRLWDFQKEAAEVFQEKQKVIVLKARQMGFSWLAMAYVVWSVLYKSNFHVYITSVGLREVTEQMERIRFIWYNLPEWITQDVQLGGKGNKDNDSLIEFSNGSAIHAVASSKAAGHGSAPGLYILDEFARKEQDVLAWRAIKPSLGKHSQVLIISTSNGFNNLFAELWFGATSRSNEFSPVFYPANRHPDYTPAYLEEMRRDFAGDLQGYMEAFPMKPEDAFMSSSRSVFPHERIREWKEYIRSENMIPAVGRIERYEKVDDRGKLREVVEWEDDEAGNMVVWKHPEPEHRYVAGADLAEGFAGGDWSVTVVLDVITDEIVCLFRTKVPPENYAYPVESICKYYNNAFLVVEVNKNSEIVMQDLKVSYPWLYCRDVREKLADKPTQIPGFLTTSSTKPRIIHQLKRSFVDQEHYIKIYSDVILDEFSAFEQKDTGGYGAASGLHDDCVMAVAFAVEGKTKAPTKMPGLGRGNNLTDMFRTSKQRRSWRSL